MLLIVIARSWVQLLLGELRDFFSRVHNIPVSLAGIASWQWLIWFITCNKYYHYIIWALGGSLLHLKYSSYMIISLTSILHKQPFLLLHFSECFNPLPLVTGKFILPPGHFAF